MASLFRVERTVNVAERIDKSLSRCPAAGNSFQKRCVLDARQPGTVFKKLDTRQSDILIEFSGNISFNSPENY